MVCYLHMVQTVSVQSTSPLTIAVLNLRNLLFYDKLCYPCQLEINLRRIRVLHLYTWMHYIFKEKILCTKLFHVTDNEESRVWGSRTVTAAPTLIIRIFFTAFSTFSPKDSEIIHLGAEQAFPRGGWEEQGIGHNSFLIIVVKLWLLNIVKVSPPAWKHFLIGPFLENCHTALSSGSLEVLS